MTTAADALDLIDAVIDTFRQLRVLGAALHGSEAPLTGERGVLFELARRGPQTVPAIARTLATSRQHVQVIVDRFLGEGIVERRPNPIHRRSVLIRLTGAGRREVKSIERRERRLLTGISPKLNGRRLREAAATLRKLGDVLQSSLPEPRR